MWLEPPYQKQPLHRPGTCVSHAVAGCRVSRLCRTPRPLLCRYMCDELLDQEVMRGLFQERLDGEANPKGPAPKDAAPNKRKQKVGGC